MSDIEFFDKNREELALMEELGMYPPRFHVVITRLSTTSHHATIVFKGAMYDIELAIPLIPPPGNSESYQELLVRKRDQDEDHHGVTIPEHQNTNQNVDTDQGHSQAPPQEHVIHENLSLTLAPIPGPIIDQERPDWFAETCKMTETDIEDALQREDSLTYSHETQILLPTSGPPIDLHNTREYIPTCFTPVATLSQCTHDGRWYYDEHNDFGLDIPAGAIPEGESIAIDIGVALYGPYPCLSFSLLLVR